MPTEAEVRASIERNKENSRKKGIVPIDERRYTCLYCNVVFQKKWPPKKGNIFCSKSCSSKYRFSIDGAKEKHAANVKKAAFIKRGGTPTKKKLPKNCKSCSVIVSTGKYCIECKEFAFTMPLFKKLGIDESITLKERGVIAKKMLMDLYFDKRMSMIDIQREFKVNMNTLHKFAKKTGFKLRTISQGAFLAFAEGRATIGNYPKFKQGWHTTWEGKKFYYRSSYEYDVCNDLDAQHTSYDMETLRIQYFDSQKQQTRTALPDFHLPSSNEIWEVKSTYFFNKINMQDKFQEYKKRGYGCKLILEHKEYSYDEVLNM